MERTGMKSCLITGGNGYLAHSLVAELRGKCRIRRMLRPGNRQPAPEAGVENFFGDVTDRKDIERALEGVDTVFHLAAQTSASVSDRDPERDYEANVRPLEYILEVCRLRQPETIVLLAGTVTQTGIPRRLPVDESAPDEPASAYDRHKLKAEKMLAEACRDGSVRGAALRLSNLYGPGPAEKGADRGILNRMIRQALRAETLTLYGSGEFLRDYLYVEDAARAFALAAQNIDAVNGRHFVIASGTGHTLAEAAHLIAAQAYKRTGRETAVRTVPAPRPLTPLELRDFVGKPDAFASATGWRPLTDLDSGIKRSMDYWGRRTGPAL